MSATAASDRLLEICPAEEDAHARLHDYAAELVRAGLASRYGVWTGPGRGGWRVWLRDRQA